MAVPQQQRIGEDGLDDVLFLCIVGEQGEHALIAADIMEIEALGQLCHVAVRVLKMLKMCGRSRRSAPRD